MFFGICLFGKKNKKLKLDNSISLDQQKNVELNYKKLENQKNLPAELSQHDVENGFVFEIDDLKKLNLKEEELEEYIVENKKGIAKLLFNLFNQNSQELKELQDYHIKNLKDFNSSQEQKTDNNEIIDIFGKKKPPLSWKDPKTGLIWEVKNKNNYDKLYSYKEAEHYVKLLNRSFYDHSSKWRIPTIDELMTLGNIPLFDYRNKNLQFSSRAAWKVGKSKFRNGKLFVKKPLSGFMNAQIETWYWSSTPVEPFHEQTQSQSNQIERLVELFWVVNFFEGGNYHIKAVEKNSVICVRKED